MCMGGSASPPPVPTPPQAAVAPTPSAARQSVVNAMSQMQGNGSTLLTGGTGVAQTPDLGKKTLLGQ